MFFTATCEKALPPQESSDPWRWELVSYVVLKLFKETCVKKKFIQRNFFIMSMLPNFLHSSTTH